MNSHASDKADTHAASGQTMAITTSSSDHSAGNAGTSGDVSQPQPLSTADQNSGGANGQCPGATYCSTRDGSPSLNGNGGGNATGKPCAGCVGKADNKNPPGQESTDPYGTFPNNGYECDHNNGIGKSNPAHTGCQGTTTCDSSVEDCGGGGGGGCDSTTQDCGGGGGCDASTQDCGGGDCDTETSNADCTPGCPAGEVMGDSGDCMPTEECVPTAANDFCSTVEGEHHTRNPKPSTKPSTQPTTDVLGEKVIKTPSALPFTGAEGIGLMLGTAALAMTVGGGLMVAARRRRDELG